MSDYNDTSRYRLPANLRQQVGLGRISTDARDRGVQRSGLGIESIERAYLAEQVIGTADYSSLTATSWTAIDSTNLQWSLTTSGTRPVELMFSVLGLAPAAQTLYLSFLWDGTEVTSAVEGMSINVISSSLAKMHGFHTMMDVGPGTHTLALAYKVSGGTGVVYNNGFRIFVRAKEV